MLANLLENARTHTPPSTPVEVRVAQSGDAAIIEVRDHGPGLRTTNPKLLIRLLHSTKPGHRGLGLITVERVARLHGGALEFESLADGALVTLRLPAAR